MPGAVHMHEYPSYMGARVSSTAVAPDQVSFRSSDGGFIIWLVLIGLVLPVAIVGGLKLGGFQFVFRSR